MHVIMLWTIFETDDVKDSILQHFAMCTFRIRIYAVLLSINTDWCACTSNELLM